MNTEQIISVVIFLVILAGIISEKFDITVLALTGAAAMIAFKIIPLGKVMGYVDFDTIAVLLGMMIIVAIFRKTGFFEYIAILTAKVCKGDSLKILFALGLITALFSAILDNVTTVLLMGPITLLITKMLKVNPIPFIITEIFASNIGGTSTLIGDPPNIMLGSAAGLNFTDFLTHLFPVTIVILIFTIIILYVLNRKHLFVEEHHKIAILKLNPKEKITDKKLLIKGFIVIFFVLLGFIFTNQIGLDAGAVAMIGACVFLLISKTPMETIINDVEWNSILFFVGLFIMVGGLVQTGVINMIANLIIHYGKGDPILLMMIMLWGSAIVSSFLNNIPFVATLIPLVLVMGKSGIDIAPLWWAISLGACLGGNGSLIGASANVVLSGISEKNGYKITFVEYLKIGFPLMIFSMIICTGYLLMLYA
ncbi:ArsB/NhaD family transporter [uncultured Clostridium sp.]|jgi:Na+/H+ antiporter NhaD/arsenite permease-like protein|uniref:ArsB/NhaD family transporter n=1 Tax=uncultured Clostridium sp. TaxID=59620 RepID=UPI002614EC4B|nr:ArsB/NhaD family transporter [uncultured Clostridium sp.]